MVQTTKKKKKKTKSAKLLKLQALELLHKEWKGKKEEGGIGLGV